MIKTTCKECPPKTQRFCRRAGAAMNSKVCETAQTDIKEARQVSALPRWWSGRGFDK